MSKAESPTWQRSTALDARLGDPQEMTFPEDWTLSESWQRAQTEDDHGGPTNDAERMVHLEDSEDTSVMDRLLTCGATCIPCGLVLSSMATEDPPVETKVSDRGMVTIPADLRRRLDIKAGDKLRWYTDEQGDLSVEVVKQRYGAFEGDEMKAPMGGDSLETHDLAGNEEDPVFTEDA